MNRKKAMVEAANAIEGLEKLSAEQASRLASFEKRSRCEKLAEKMIEKGLLNDSVVEYKTKIAQLMRKEDLDSWEKAVEINFGGLDLGEEDDREKTASVKGADQIMALLLNDES